MVRSAAIALACLALFACPAPASAQSDEAAAAAALQKFQAEYGPELVATAELMLWVGTCEPYISKTDVDAYLSEFAMTDEPSSDFLSHALAALHMRMYVSGRKDREKLNYSREQCRTVLREVSQEAIAARKLREEREAKQRRTE